MGREAGVPPSMVAVGASLLAIFLTLVGATISSVLNDPVPEAPDLRLLALPVEADIVDSHTTCVRRGCDGHDLVVAYPDSRPDDAIGMVADSLRTAGWFDRPGCGVDACLAHGDLRARFQPWSEVDPAVAPNIHADGGVTVHEGGLVYIRFYRCGLVEDCAGP